MGFIELFIISIGVSMDAFAVSICKGLSMKELNIKKALTIGLYFGFFQAIMPLIGYSFGEQFKRKVGYIDHWIVLILLSYIGLTMIYSALKDTDNPCDCSTDFKNMFILALATSMDALAIGISLTFFKVKIVRGVLLIGIITFILSVIGVRIGSIFGVKYKSRAEFVGGLILIYLGLRIFLDSSGFILF